MSLPFSILATTDTFRTWFNLTNNVVSILNGSTVADNTTAYGVFTIGANANTSLSVAGLLTVNSTLILTKGNTTLAANVSVSSNANVFNLAAGTFLIQPLNGTIVNSALTINATTLVLSPLTTNAAVTVNGTLTLTGAGNLVGNITSTGVIQTWQVAYAGANAIVAANLANPEYDDYAPTGVDGAQLLNLTPGIDTVITGIQAPTTLGTTGARILYIQNLSTSFKITLPSANTSSSANNRFKTNGDNSIIVLPGTALGVIWTTGNKEWRPLIGNITTPDLSLTGNLSVGGTLTVTGVSTFNSNANFGTTLIVDQTNGRVGVDITPTVPFHVSGNSLFGNLVIQGAVALSANLTSTANSYLSNSTLQLVANNLNATFGNTITANSSSQSYIRSLLVTTLVSNSSATLANVSITGNTTDSGVYKMSGSTARFVLPVGVNFYAT